MKHLLRINELNRETYVSAAEKLRKKGGVHKERGQNILDWANMPGIVTLDKFKVKLYQVEGKRGIDYVDSLKKGQVAISDETEAKLKYIASWDILGLEEGEFKIEEIGGLTLGFAFEYGEGPITLFTISTPVRLENDILIVEGDAQIQEEFYTYPVLFSNRKDAFRFKKIVLNEEFLLRNCEEFEKIKELFFLHSRGPEEYKKFLNGITSISVNDLFS
jgi:hypothetical protein